MRLFLSLSHLSQRLVVLLLATSLAPAVAAGFQDKTLVVWAAPANHTQRGGSALTLEDNESHFDGIVFGEISAERWMPGSDNFRRTLREQDSWPKESAGPTNFVQLAAVYQGRSVTLYRNGELYAKYEAANLPPQFGSAAIVLFGRRHLEAGDPDNSFAGRIRDARIYDQPLDQETVARLRPGQSDGGPEPWAWWSFADEGLREKTGRFSEIKLVGDVRIKNGALELPGRGATLIAVALGDESGKRVFVPRPWSLSSPVPAEALQSSRLLRERFLADPFRPRYHFCVPEDMGEPGDPNGAFYYQGRYHLMYLYNRSGSGFCWGHISSEDLIHWRHHPDSIGPGDGDEGCFSGGAFVDDDGKAYLSYWMLWGAKGVGLASSMGPQFDQWTKFRENPVIRSTEWGVTAAKDSGGQTIHYGSADPSNIWKRDGKYYMLTGNLLVLNKLGREANSPLSEQGDRLYLFRSENLKDWQYLHSFYERNPSWTDRSEDNMCPSFLPLPSSPDGGPPSNKHLLLFISHNMGCQYYVGTYLQDRFLPERHGRMTWVDNTYFAPEALIDGKGRQIMWAWLTDNPPGEKPKGWSGVYGLPRTVWLNPEGALGLKPAPELESLRMNEKIWASLQLTADSSRNLEGVVGDACELELEIEPGTAQQCGLNVRASEGGEEETLLYYDASAGQLVFDSTRSGTAGRKVVERAPFSLNSGELLKLRVFVDRSVVEVFANDRQAIGRRVYPGRSDSLGVALFCRGGPARFVRVRAWEMAASNPY